MPSPTKILANFGFTKTERRIDGITGRVTDVLSFPRRSGGTGTAELPPSKMLKPHELAGLLADRDADLPLEKSDRLELLVAISAAPAVKTVRYAAHAGWNETRTIFIAQQRVFGTAEPDTAGLRPRRHLSNAGILKMAGTADGWRDIVGKLAENSTCALIAVSLALAAPLLAVARCPPFAVNFFGAGRSGKSTCTLAAASLIGLGTMDDIPTWSTSPTGLEERLPEFRDLPLVLDDLMNMGGSPAERFQRISHDSYTLASGQAKVRSAHYSGDNELPQAWRTIVITQNELSIVAEGHALRKARTGGSAARLIDIPAASTGGEVFDRLRTSPDQRIEARDQAISDLLDACKRHHGAALERYVAYLMSVGDDLLAKVQRLSNEFTRRVKDEADTGLVGDLIGKFGLMYAAARLGIAASVVPWAPELATDAIRTGFLGARELLPDDSRLLRDGIRALDHGLRSLPIRRPGEVWASENANGYRFRRGGRNQCYVRVNAFSNWFGSINQRELVENWLIAESKAESAITRVDGPPRLKDQFLWPDRERVRSIHIEWAACIK